MFHAKLCCDVAIVIIIMTSQKISRLGKEYKLIRFPPLRSYDLTKLKFNPGTKTLEPEQLLLGSSGAGDLVLGSLNRKKFRSSFEIYSAPTPCLKYP